MIKFNFKKHCSNLGSNIWKDVAVKTLDHENLPEVISVEYYNSESNHLIRGYPFPTAIDYDIRNKFITYEWMDKSGTRPIKSEIKHV